MGASAVTDDLGQVIADAQAMALINRHLLSCLYEIVLKDDPRAEAKLRAVSDDLISFVEASGNPTATARLAHLIDSFVSGVHERVVATTDQIA